MIVAPKIFFLDLGARRASVARLEGNQALHGILRDRLADVAVAPCLLQYNPCLAFNRLIDRMFQVATEHVGFGVIHVIRCHDRLRHDW